MLRSASFLSWAVRLASRSSQLSFSRFSPLDRTENGRKQTNPACLAPVIFFFVERNMGGQTSHGNHTACTQLVDQCSEDSQPFDACWSVLKEPDGPAPGDRTALLCLSAPGAPPGRSARRPVVRTAPGTLSGAPPILRSEEFGQVTWKDDRSLNGTSTDVLPPALSPTRVVSLHEALRSG